MKTIQQFLAKHGKSLQRLAPLGLFFALLGTLWACGGGGGGGTTIGGGAIGGNTGTRIAGRVVEDILGTGVQSITVQFFNAAGVRVGQASSNSTGNFQATVTDIPTRLHILSGSIGSGYYKSYAYKVRSYSSTISTCKAPIATVITLDVLNSITNITLTPATSPPPPPPNGCL